jgi:pimeloyl-ACP methyl ester carboxylesterase
MRPVADQPFPSSAWASHAGTVTIDSTRPTRTRHQFAEVDGQRVFYREAGDARAPVVVLLHGAPASSFMFRDLIPLLASDYHVIAPDYLGFGLSDAPPVDQFAYSFDALTDSVETLLQQLGVTRYVIYVQDYGAPVGWRLILRNPEAVIAVITQNGNAYVEGFVPSFWEPLWTYAADSNPETEQPIREGLTLDAIRWQYTHGEPDPALVSPDAWHHDFAVLQRPGDMDVQLALLRQYRTNIALYPAVHEWLRTAAVPVLAVWGRNDEIFGPAGAEAFRTDAADVQVELLDGGHFLLEAHVDAVAVLVREFLRRALGGNGDVQT